LSNLNQNTVTNEASAAQAQQEGAEQAKQKKPYVYPHKHCNYCGKMIELRGRDYCFKCKTEHGKEQSKISKNKKYRRYFMYYVAFVAILFVAVIIYSYL